MSARAWVRRPSAVVCPFGTEAWVSAVSSKPMWRTLGTALVPTVNLHLYGETTIVKYGRG